MSRLENTAEHSWSVALAAMVLTPTAAPHLDQFRIIKMLLIHDLVEIDAGDTYVYGDQSGKAEREYQAASRLFGMLPQPSHHEFHQLWQEFEDQETEESRFAHCIDRLLPLLQNYRNGGKSWERHGIVFDQVYQRNLPTEDISPELWTYVEKIILAAKSEGLLPESRKQSGNQSPDAG